MPHTPAPWHLSPEGRYVRYERDPDGNRYTPPHGPNICDCSVFGGPPEEGGANARLIAAAPELLGVLTRLVRRIDQGERITPDFNVMGAARAALATARDAPGVDLAAAAAGTLAEVCHCDTPGCPGIGLAGDRCCGVPAHVKK